MSFEIEGSKLKEYLEQGGEEAAQSIEDAFQSASKSLTSSIKKSLRDGSNKFTQNFQQSAQESLRKVSESQMDIIIAGGGDAAKAWNESVDGFISNNLDSTELAAAGKHLLDKLPERLRGIISTSVEGAINNAELSDATKNWESATKEGIEGALSGLPSNAFTKAVGIDTGIAAGAKEFSKKFSTQGAKVGQFIAKNWKVALGAALVFAIISQLDTLTNDIGESFGAIGVQNFKTDLIAARAEFTKMGMSAEDLSATVKGLSGDFGLTTDQAIAMAGGIADTSKALGVSAAEGTKLVGLLMTTSGLSGEQAQNFLKGAEQMAVMNGVAPGVIMADIAASSEDVAAFTKEGGQNIAQAAVQARKFGVNLGTVAKSARGLLNFSDSLNAELEASVMLGRSINLQKARELSLSGDLAGVAAEISKQVGGQAEFEKMNVLERESLAAAVGMSVEELSKFVSLQGKSNSELKKTTDYDVSKVVGPEAIGNITALKNDLEAAKLQMLSFIASIATLGGLLDDGPAFLVALNVGLLALGAYLIFTVGRTLMQALANRVLAKSIGKVVEAQSKQKGNKGPKMGWLKNMGKNMGAILKGAAALLIVSGAMLIAGFAFKLFSDDIDWVSVMFGVGILVALGIAAALLGSFAPLILVGAGALMMVAGAMLIAAVASIAFGLGSQMMIPFLEFMVEKGTGLLFPLAGLALGLYALSGALVILGITQMMWFPALILLSAGMALLGVGMAMSSVGMGLFNTQMATMIANVGGMAEVSLVLVGFAGSLFLLSAAFAAVAFTGALALPILMGVGLLGGAAIGGAMALSSTGGKDEEGSNTKDLYNQLVLMNDRLITIEENFQKNWIPAIVDSNVEGAKKGAKESSRSFVQKLGF